MAPVNTNEREGTRAVLRYYHMSASKARLVLDLIRGVDVLRAQDILASTPREAAQVVAKVLASAVANAQNNDGQAVEELYVASAFADEGPTLKRFRPRARGRASKIFKRTCHVTIIVARMDEAQLARKRASRSAGADRSQRVSASRRRADQQSHARHRETAREEAAAAAEAEAAAAAEAEAHDHEGHDHEGHDHEGHDHAVADDAAVEETADETADETEATEADAAAETETTEAAPAAEDEATDVAPEAASEETTD
jgi:large subunit ribosomal protein L22